MSGGGFTAEELKAAEKLFRGECGFATAASVPASLPPETLPEIAFAGRSNVGKSSLINALTGRKALARASNTPGRTRQINFFDLAGRVFLVDLPGYGHAKAPKTEIAAWTTLIRAYLGNRPALKCACLLIDARRGFMEADLGALGHFADHGVPCRVVLTKCDKMKPAALAAVRAAMLEALEAYPAAPGIIETSAAGKGVKDNGIPLLRATLAADAGCA